MEDVVILGAARTPIGSFQGSLRSVPSPLLGATAITGALQSAQLEPDDIEQVYMGSVLTAGVGQAPARQAALAAGCPDSTGAVTVGKVCGSSMRAIMTAGNDLRCGDFDVVVAGGMESMSRSPYLAPGAREGMRLGHGRLTDSMILDGLWDPYGDKHMGNCAELCAVKYSFTREDQDSFARESYHRARKAVEEGSFRRETVSVELAGKKGSVGIVDTDEEPFRVDLEKMPRLQPAFQRDGTVTAGNASKINDGAAALVMTTRKRAERLGRRPIARLVAQASWAQEPEWFTTAPVAAVRRVLERAGLTAAEIDLWEVNEAFAAVAMAFSEELGLSSGRVNVYGGAVALGHPIGASGARIVVTLMNAMRERQARLGCAAICIGGGEATALLLENIA
jgi:acetyl-CoA C-acetyltransferase